MTDDSTTMGRLAWACRMRRRPRTVVGYLRLLRHDFVTHGLFGPGGERCQDCGCDYPLWWAEGDLWESVFGTDGGLSCPGCFDRRATKAGITVEFRAVRFER